jgi:hypothetical protein
MKIKNSNVKGQRADSKKKSQLLALCLLINYSPTKIITSRMKSTRIKPVFTPFSPLPISIPPLKIVKDWKRMDNSG